MMTMSIMHVVNSNSFRCQQRITSRTVYLQILAEWADPSSGVGMPILAVLPDGKTLAAVVSYH